MRRPKREDFPYFDGTESNMDITELIPGCARPDCIPSLDNPVWIPTPEDYTTDEEVIALLYKNEIYAVSKFILNVHEIVNFTVADGTPLAITYCPLCQTEKGYLRKIGMDEIELGVSGLLWNSALVLYDRKSLSLFSQALSLGIVGKYVDVDLTEVSVVDTTVDELSRTFPVIKYLSKDTGSKRSKHYSSNPYADYENTDNVIFPVSHKDELLPPKERVFVVEGKIISEKMLNEDLVKLGDSIFAVKIAGFPVFFRGKAVAWNSNSIEEFLESNSLKLIRADYCFYFTARAYHPDFEIMY